MAAGDITWFNAAKERLLRGELAVITGSIKLGLITSATTPTAGAADPRWGAGGGTNLSTNQVATGTSYASGGPALATKSIAIVAGEAVFRADNIVVAQDAAGFANARWGILYQDDANDYAIAFLDLGSDRSIQAGSLTIDWNGATNDVLKVA